MLRVKQLAWSQSAWKRAHIFLVLAGTWPCSMPCPAGNVTLDLRSSYPAKKQLLFFFFPPQTAVPRRTIPSVCSSGMQKSRNAPAFALSLVALLISYNFAWKVNAGLTHAGSFPSGRSTGVCYRESYSSWASLRQHIPGCWVDGRGHVRAPWVGTAEWPCPILAPLPGKRNSESDPPLPLLKA